MTRNTSKQQKQAPNVDSPYPRHCYQCGKDEVVISTMPYEASVRHDGRLHTFTIPDLRLPVCEACGEKVFTEDVDDQVNDALRVHLRLLTPQQIREAIGRMKLSQKVVSTCTGVAEATLSRWLNETQIQSRAMDNLLRVFFAFPQVRNVLCGDKQDPALGLSDTLTGEPRNLTERDRGALTRKTSWMEKRNDKRAAYRNAQEVVSNAGSTWGTRRVG